MSDEKKSKLSRRTLLKRSVSAGFLFAGFPDFKLLSFCPTLTSDDASEESRFLGPIDFVGEGLIPMEMPMGSGLDGRLYTDLSSIKPGHPITPTEKFFLRTRVPDMLPRNQPWAIKTTGSKRRKDLDISTLRTMSRPTGAHLMECSGNVRVGHFGMLSVADWAGVPVARVLDSIGIEKGGSRVLISGFDSYSIPSTTSEPGASWIFTVEELNASGAFFATEMNGAALTRDHGAPIRLVVPGWYGCTCIKWVNEIAVVGEDAPATSQMREYASRTMQDGEPKLAKDYKPGIIEQAAMPVLVEEWLVRRKINYKVQGIAWGGTRPAGGLEIRFNQEEDFVPVDVFKQTFNDPWSFWTHEWTPKQPGRYSIQLRLMNRSIPARRLDAGYYVRSVDITEV
jgi:DMSO/TMAO reductase YedYZ molybdopterin-dependent catalytic subunit